MSAELLLAGEGAAAARAQVEAELGAEQVRACGPYSKLGNATLHDTTESFSSLSS